MSKAANGSEKQKARVAAIRRAKCHLCKAQAVEWFQKKYWCGDCLTIEFEYETDEKITRRHVSGIGVLW